MITNVPKIVWENKMANLMKRRTKETIKSSVPAVNNYLYHVTSCNIGNNVLDVGCGSMAIKNCLSYDVKYTGIDPYPVNEQVVKMSIEECTFEDNQFETVYAFAMLDNVMDLDKALNNIKRVCSKNAVFLTGVNIIPDQYHTIEITEAMLIDKMKPFKIGHMEYLAPHVLLIEFVK